MNCATELLHPANFCPVCGARLAAPVTDGSAATVQVGETPAVTTGGPSVVPDDNVVRLPFDAPATMAANPRAHDYEGVEQFERPPSAGPTPVQRQPPTTDRDNPFGDFFADGPSAWLEDADEDSEEDVPTDRVRIVGTMLALGAALMFVAAWAVWVRAMVRGSGGAEAGGFILLGSLFWIWYLALPRAKQHRALLRLHTRIASLVDRRVTPLRTRTEGQLALRRERDRYRALRDERNRRIAALGEGAYRAFRMGRLPVEMQGQAQRVMAMERQMLVQDHRIKSIVERAESGDGADPAASDPAGGQPPA
ncbi:MAG: hypothetical protein JWO69_1083 [Thermoleophilia bacterium]|nr:hypothetical protein [Thermoleophilia bacterium]